MVARGIPTGEALRSAHIKTLAQMSLLENENGSLKAALAEAKPPDTSSKKLPERYKQEELDSLYVEERRQIEGLQAELESMRKAQANAHKVRDTELQAQLAHLPPSAERFWYGPAGEVSAACRSDMPPQRKRVKVEI